MHNLQELSDKVRGALGDALKSRRVDRFAPLHLARVLLATANDLAGRPLCSREELAQRRAGTGPHPPAQAAKRAPRAREAAPVVLYFDGKDHRTKAKLEQTLEAAGVPFQVNDVASDEATRSWVETMAKTSEYPLVFIAGESVGGLAEVTQLDVNGQLSKRVFGA
jgi:glutaredoxin-related protein